MQHIVLVRLASPPHPPVAVVGPMSEHGANEWVKEKLNEGLGELFTFVEEKLDNPKDPGLRRLLAGMLQASKI